MDPVANGLHPFRAVGDLAEMLEGEVQQFVRIAVAARQRVAQDAIRQIFHRMRRADARVAFPGGRHPDQRIVADFVQSLGQLETVNDVAVRIVVFVQPGERLDAESFAVDLLCRALARLERQDDRRGDAGAVGNLTPGALENIERGRDGTLVGDGQRRGHGTV